MEIWKDILGYEGYYQVSNLGRVRRVSGKVFRKATRRNIGSYILRQEKILSQCLTGHRKKKYSRVTLTREGREKSAQVHRLVALAFLPLVKKKKEVNHKNGIKTDNRVENLEWCDHQDNVNHAISMGIYQKGETNGQSKLTERQVLEIRGKWKKRVVTFTDLAVEYKVTVHTIAAVVQRKSWKYL